MIKAFGKQNINTTNYALNTYIYIYNQAYQTRLNVTRYTVQPQLCMFSLNFKQNLGDHYKTSIKMMYVLKNIQSNFYKVG